MTTAEELTAITVTLVADGRARRIKTVPGTTLTELFTGRLSQSPMGCTIFVRRGSARLRHPPTDFELENGDDVFVIPPLKRRQKCESV